MKRLLSSMALLMLGFALGWYSQTWHSQEQASITAGLNNQVQRRNPNAQTSQTTEDKRPTTPTGNIPTAASILAQFTQQLNEQRYQAAMQLYQQQERTDKQMIPALKESLLRHLNKLMNRQDQNNFSTLTGLFLSLYYDDIDVLLLLAAFNQTNDAYIEAINVYQLANTYAYTQAKQQKVQNQLTQFVNATDQHYSEKQDWFALTNFYAYLETTGLLTPWHQYRQAIAHLNNGNQATAIAQLRQLQNNPIVGAQATTTLDAINAHPINTQPPQDQTWQNTESIALQQRDNHYLIDITLNQQDKVTLLIDTGASITTLTQAAFSTLNSISQATELGVRLFQTANGPTTSTVYTMPQLNIGPHQINNVQIAVMDFSMPQGVDGLLGMNVLGQYRFQIDQKNARLLLREK